ncbi:unnamed protein product, partial [Effrenium voratum]
GGGGQWNLVLEEQWVELEQWFEGAKVALCMEELQENEWMEMRHELQENGWDETAELCY